MSGELQPPGTAAGVVEAPAPLLPPAHAAVLLDEVIYEQVLECVDLDALVRLERSLVLMIGEIDDVSDDRARDLAMSMIDRAVVRLPDDVRGYLKVANLLSLDCELCDEESRQHRSTVGTSRRRGAPRAS
jgi:hypothetical protein